MVTTLSRDDYQLALAKAYDDPESYALVEKLIDSHFAMLKHLKETSLYDVLEYEKRVTNGTIEPMRILAYDNGNSRKRLMDYDASLVKSRRIRRAKNERNSV